MSSVIMTLGALSDGMVTRSEWMDGVLPRGLVMLTLGGADGVDSNEGEPGRGIPRGEICQVT